MRNNSRLNKSLFHLFVFLSIISSVSSCAQEYRASGMIEDVEYDQKLFRLLNQEVPAIGVKDFAKLNDNVILIDVRSPEEFRVSHIDGAINIDYDDFDLEKLKELDKNSDIVVYCSVGYRSEKITEKLLDAGYPNALNLYGSIFEWVNQSHPIVDINGEETHDVHVYNKKWGQWMKNDNYKKVY